MLVRHRSSAYKVSLEGATKTPLPHLRRCWSYPKRLNGLPGHAQSARVWINGGSAVSSPFVRSRNVVERRPSMGNEGSYVALGLKVWRAQIERADKFFGGLSSEDVVREIAPGKNRLLYLWGHLTAIHDAMLPLLGLGERLHPEFDVAFVSNPDKSRADIPSPEQVRRAWNVVNTELWKGFAKMSSSDWVQRHTSVSEEDFAKDASRNRFSILLSRTNHLSYHLGQAVLGLK